MIFYGRSYGCEKHSGVDRGAGTVGPNTRLLQRLLNSVGTELLHSKALSNTYTHVHTPII